MLRPLKRYLVYKKTGNRKSLISPEKVGPEVHHAQNYSFQSIYEQLNNTRLLSNKSSMNSSPFGKQQRVAKVVREAQFKNIHKAFEAAGEDSILE